ncbi:MAG: CoA transferase, partial [Caldilineae bacterium]
FAGRDVCVEPVLTVEEMLAHPQTRARGLVVSVPKPEGGVQQQIGSPFKFSRAQTEYRHTGLPLGANTESVLAEAGFAPDEIAQLRAAGVFGK